jgi:mRNA-degrading endonuclease RelE of RelBE toxin-antitoxin system
MQSAQNPENEINDSSDQQSLQPVVQIDLTPEFKQNLRDLAKRYRSIRSDVDVLIKQLEAGQFVGDRIPGIGKGYAVFKVRVRNRDIQKGKSAGYRLIYQVESQTSVLLLTVYSKSDHEDISIKEIGSILGEYYGSG